MKFKHAKSLVTTIKCKYSRNMVSTMRRCLLIFLFTEAYLCNVDADYNGYVSLITGVHDEYSKSGVFFIFPEKNLNMEEYTTVHSLSRTFSKQGIFTLTTNFDDLSGRLNYYRKRINRPLAVVMLKSIGDVDKFDNCTRGINKSFPVWLMIFHGNFGDPVCEYCHRPSGNRFGLRFDTTMIVFCCGNFTLREWWSMDGNSTKTGNIGNWTASERLTLLPIDVRKSQRYDTNGLKLRVSLAPNQKNYTRKLFDEFQRAMSFTPTMTVPVDTPIGNSTKESRFSLLDVLTKGKTDMVVGMMFMTESRTELIDFTKPFVLLRAKLYFREPDAMGVHFAAYFEVFEFKIWLIIIALIIATAVLMTIIKAQYISKSWISLWIENYICVWGIFCQQWSFKFPAEEPMRIALVSTCISAMVVSIAYSANLMSSLATISTALPFSDLDGFVRDGSYKLIWAQNSPDSDTFRSSNVSLLKKMAMLMKPREDLPVDSIAAFHQVCNERVALWSNGYFRSVSDVKCKIVEIDTGHLLNGALALPAGSQYTVAFNYYITRFAAAGLFHRLKMNHLGIVVAAPTTYGVVKLSRVATIISILAGGIILALIVLFCETIYCAYDDRRRCFLPEIESRKSKLLKFLDPRRIERLWTKYS